LSPFFFIVFLHLCVGDMLVHCILSHVLHEMIFPPWSKQY
jgi:hypothetical protein